MRIESGREARHLWSRDELKTKTVSTTEDDTQPAQPTMESAEGARQAMLNDAGTQHRMKSLQSSALESRPPGTPFKSRTREQIDGLLAKVDESGDLSRLNAIDNFRQTLTPELQAEYDRQLEALRSDPRIVFQYEGGVERSAAMEDLALRGMVAATFGDPSLLDRTLDTASSESGQVPIVFKPGEGGAVANADGSIEMQEDFFRNVLAQGDNAFLHEFSHLSMRVQESGDEPDLDQRFPADFPYEEAVLREFESDQFQEFLGERFGVDTGEGTALDGAETFPTLQNLFRQSPEELSEASPEIYRAFTEYYGYDPLTQTSSNPVQLNGAGDLEDTAQTTLDHFDQITDGDTFSRGDLEALLSDPDPAVPQEVRAAAAFLLSSDVSHHFLDVGAGRGDVDGDISRDDLTTALADIRSGSYEDLLLDTAAGRGGRDGNISEDDIEAAESDPGVSL